MKFKMSKETPAGKHDYSIVPSDVRGEIKGTHEWRKASASNEGRKPTNKEYASQNGCSVREASRKRRGY
jgi:hypothetical protein